MKPHQRLKYLKVLMGEIPEDMSLPWKFTAWLSRAIEETSLTSLAGKLERARKRLAKVDVDKETRQKQRIKNLARDLHNEGFSYNQIAKELHRRRYRAPRGGMFSRTQIGRLVKRQ